VADTELAAAEGTDRLEALVVRNHGTGIETRVPADGLVILIGQKSYTDWADGLLARDEQGFLLAGPDLPPAQRRSRARSPRGARPAAFGTTSRSRVLRRNVGNRLELSDQVLQRSSKNDLFSEQRSAPSPLP
jgi:hypothetical protein